MRGLFIFLMAACFSQVLLADDSGSITLRLPEPSVENKTPEEIMEEERWIAQLFSYSKKVRNNPIGRIMIHFVEDLLPQIEKIAEYEMGDDIVEEELSEDQSVMDYLPIEKLAEHKKFLKRAWIRFDEETETWRAKWQKPKVFHFGMLLKPALEHQVPTGQSFQFESNGQNLVISKADNKLMVGLEEGNLIELGAKQLRQLLEHKVTVDDLSLFLDRKGNLILEAKGKAARALSQIRG